MTFKSILFYFSPLCVSSRGLPSSTHVLFFFFRTSPGRRRSPSPLHPPAPRPHLLPPPLGHANLWRGVGRAGPPSPSISLPDPPPAGEGNGEFTLVWDSIPGRTYTILFNRDLNGPLGSWGDIGDDFEADAGETTTLTFPNPDPGANRLFFIVILNSD